MSSYDAETRQIMAGLSPKAREIFKKKLAAVQNNVVQVGSIFYSSWGYDQTNVNFYEVVKMAGNASVAVRKLAHSVISTKDYGDDIIMPIPGKFEGPAVIRRLKGSYIKVNASEVAELWDGKPKAQTSFGHGH